jgi:hypothetical protein
MPNNSQSVEIFTSNSVENDSHCDLRSSQKARGKVRRKDHR